nr:unnamed protein product [Spirometra erinaceieuropaei]
MPDARTLTCLLAGDWLWFLRGRPMMARLVLESWSSVGTINRAIDLHPAYQALRTRLQSVQTGPTVLASESRLLQQLSPLQQGEGASRRSHDERETSPHRRAQTAERDSHMQRQLISPSDYELKNNDQLTGRVEAVRSPPQKKVKGFDIEKTTAWTETSEEIAENMTRHDINPPQESRKQTITTPRNVTEENQGINNKTQTVHMQLRSHQRKQLNERGLMTEKRETEIGRLRSTRRKELPRAEKQSSSEQSTETSSAGVDTDAANANILCIDIKDRSSIAPNTIPLAAEKIPGVDGNQNVIMKDLRAGISSRFFQSVFTREVAVPTDHCNVENVPTIDSVVLTKPIVQQELLKLKEGTSPGPDEIPAKLLKELATELAEPLSLLFQASLDAGRLPPEWKTAWISPIHKNGSRASANNYRPWTRAIDEGNVVHVAYIDFKKAFDSVAHQRLLYKLSRIWGAFDFEALAETLKKIRSHQPVVLNTYDPNAFSNTPNVLKIPAEIDIVIVEGILTFYQKEIRDLFHMKIFVEADADTRLSRKGWNLNTVLENYFNFVKPAFEEFCLPTKKYADVILPRAPDNVIGVELIIEHLLQMMTTTPSTTNTNVQRLRFRNQSESATGCIRPH